MMCRKYSLNDWTRYASGDTTPTERATMERHAAECPTCAMERRSVEAVFASARTLPSVETPAASLVERVWNALPSQPRSAPSRRDLLSRWAMGGLATAVAGGSIAALFILPGTPIQPTVAFAQVEQAMANIQTVTWQETLDKNLLLRPNGTFEQRSANHKATVWARINSPALTRVYGRGVRHVSFADETYQIWPNSKSGITGYSRYKWGIPDSPAFGPAKSQSPEERLRVCILFPSNKDGSPRELSMTNSEQWTSGTEKQPYTVKRSPWKSQQTTLNGVPVLRFDSQVTYKYPNPAQQSQQKDQPKHDEWQNAGDDWTFWVEPKTYRILRRDIKVNWATKKNTVSFTITSDGFRYNVTPPPGIFDVRPAVGQRYTFVPLPQGPATSDDQAVMEQTTRRLIDAWNHHDSDRFLAEWDVDYLAENPADREHRIRKERQTATAPPLRNMKLKRIWGGQSRMSGLFTQTTETTPFPPTAPVEYSAPALVTGIDSMGKKGTAFVNLNLRREGSSFKIIRMYPPHRIKNLPEQPSGTGTRPADRR